MHVFTISLKFIKENIMGAFINESDCFHYLLYKNVIFPENIYVINMSEDTPECTKLHNLKKNVRGNIYHKTTQQLLYCNNSNSLKNYTPIFEYGFTPVYVCKSIELCRKWH